MKTASIILLLGFLTYFSETIALPLAGRCVAVAKAACTPNTKGSQGCPGCLHNKQPQKHPGNGCTNTGVCLNCPLCYTMVPLHGKSAAVPVILIRTVYYITSSNTIAGFKPSKWRPPNAC